MQTFYINKNTLFHLVIYGGLNVSMSNLFSVVVNFFKAYSRFAALFRQSKSSKYTSTTGLRLRVYLAPFLPLLCCCMRLLRLLVIPVYNELSEQLTIYTHHPEGRFSTVGDIMQRLYITGICAASCYIQFDDDFNSTHPHKIVFYNCSIAVIVLSIKLL